MFCIYSHAQHEYKPDVRWKLSFPVVFAGKKRLILVLSKLKCVSFKSWNTFLGFEIIFYAWGPLGLISWNFQSMIFSGSVLDPLFSGIWSWSIFHFALRKVLTMMVNQPHKRWGSGCKCIFCLFSIMAKIWRWVKNRAHLPLCTHVLLL